MTTNNKQPVKSLLQGIKVLDLSRILAGPWATQMLADYGAEVWKIEKPDAGDDTRSWGPPFKKVNGDDLSAYFMSANRGKQSLAIDITQPQGQALIHQLARHADIVVENFKVGGLKKYGLDYEQLSALNPSLIYCSITGFGQTGPLANKPGYDAIIQAAGGLMSVTGQPDEAGGQPQKVGVAVTDLMTGMYATTAILAALNYRNMTGEGQYIDLSLLDSQLAMLANQGMNYLVGQKVPCRQGNAHPNIVPYQTFLCEDDYLMVAVGNDKQFATMCDVMALNKLALAPNYRTNTARVENRQSLIDQLQKRFQTQPRDYWLAQFDRCGVPSSAVNNIQQAIEQPQSQHRQMQIEIPVKSDPDAKVECESSGEPLSQFVPQLANPVKFSATPISYNVPPPKLGKDTSRILKKVLGLTENALEVLHNQRVIG